jgi:hypothetical protein
MCFFGDFWRYYSLYNATNITYFVSSKKLFTMGCGSSSDVQKSNTTEAPGASAPTQKSPSPAADSKNTKATKVSEVKAAAEIKADQEITWKQVHSAIRWNKSVDEVRAMLAGRDLADSKDTGNGNAPLHIAAQNGHLDHVQLLVGVGANVNSKNGKGNTPLHMALSYDYIEVSEYLMANGADSDVLNDAGIPARKGLEGEKCLAAVYLAASNSTEDVMKALDMCIANSGDLDKASFASTGMKVKKNLGADWTDAVNAKFKEVMSMI